MGKIIELAKNLYLETIQVFNSFNIANSKDYKRERLAAELIRNVHSIEKGLSIKNIRPGFGHKKQQEMLRIMSELKNVKSDYCQSAIKMAAAAISAYISYNDSIEYHDDFIDNMREEIKEYITENSDVNMGGAKDLFRSHMDFDINEIEKMFYTRHSIRDFEETPVDLNLIMKSIKLAQTCPSACNRQGVRVYVYTPDKAEILKRWLVGIGGFEDDIGAFILVTGKQSAYRQDERYQYIVSSSMFAAYLTLTLHTYGLGACVIQRPVITNKAWKTAQKELGIPKDEQAICMLGVGNLQEQCKVPVSYRLSEDIITTIK